MRACKRCGEIKPDSAYSPARLRTNSYVCRLCNNHRVAMVRAQRKAADQMARKGVVNLRHDGALPQPKPPAMTGYKEWALSRKDVLDLWKKQGGKCAITGIPFAEQGGMPRWNTASRDRIDPDGGYVKENVRLVLFCVNAFKGRMTDEDVLSVAKAIVAGLEPFSTVVGDWIPSSAWLN